MSESVLELDPIGCDGRGICAELFPEGIRLDSWGYPILRPGPVPPELLAHARWAVENCPALALRLKRHRSAVRKRK
jgi:ferredoxin